jgi:dephospho-CoA kinase
VLNVALTGNIASGKSTVTELFRRWGATIVDADSLVREAQAPGSAMLRGIVDRFGMEVLRPDGSLDRPALRAVILADPAARAALNALVHPEVHRLRRQRVAEARARGDRIVVNDIPLLFEASDPAEFDVIVLVDAPEEVRRTRLLGARGLAPEEVDRMMGIQLPSAGKRARSHYVIDNDGDHATLERRAREVWEALSARA